ncbi:hypothetical protein EMILIAHAH_229 [Bacillus phage vB_BanH_Emiliahah]|nr:hypothetical protein EMILIAHAH_229 [Bacillus phage vB_BanH_Emiliahah]
MEQLRAFTILLIIGMLFAVVGIGFLLAKFGLMVIVWILAIIGAWTLIGWLTDPGF